MPEKFQVGDLVVLKSGGPKMVVQAVSETGDTVDCVWSERYHHTPPEVTFKAVTLLDATSPEGKEISY